MAPLPNVNIELTNGNLGRLPANQDGLFGMVLGPLVADPSGATLGTSYQINSLADAEALGIDAAYEVSEDVLTHTHIREFFEERQGNGPLWVFLSSAPVTDTFNVDGPADQLMQAASGNLRLVGAMNTPPTGAPAATNGLPTAVITAVTEAKAFVARQFAAHKPVRVLIEGYAITSVAGLTYDLRASGGPNADAVGVVIGQTKDTWNEDMAAFTERFASVGRVMGRMARIAVHVNPGRVRDGAMVNVASAGFSDTSNISAATDTQLDTLNTLGYIFFRTYPGLSGVFINDDHSATVISSDYSSISRGRVIDKAARIAYQTYVLELNNDVEVDAATGRLAVSVVKNLEGVIESAIGTQMAGEISGVSAYINPDQDIVSTDELLVELNLVPRGVAKNIKVKLGFSNPLAA